MNKYFYVISISLICYLPTAYSEQCPSVRLDKNGGVFEKMKIWNQGCKLQICYSVSASQLIDAYRFTHGDNKYEHRTSPIALALLTSFNFFNKNRSIDFGHASRVLKSFEELGSCDHTYLINEFKKVGGTVDFLTKFFNKFNSLQRINAPREDIAEDINDETKINKIYPEYKPLLIDALKTSNPFSFLKTLILDKCKNNSLPYNELDLPELQTVNRQNEVQFNEKLKNHFIHNESIPVGISYCASIFKDRDYSWLDPNGIIGKECNYSHQSVIVGTRPQEEDSEKCDYLIRDSYGPECKLDRKWECENGQYWLSEEAINRNSTDFFFLKK